MGLLVWKLKNMKSRRIDDYWLRVRMAFIDKSTGKSKYNILFNFVMCVLSLSHGNSDPERGFSINKFLLDTHGNSISEVTIECIRLLKDFLIRKGGLENVDINKQMMKSCKSSHERYQLDLAAKRKQKLEEEALSNAKKQETVTLGTPRSSLVLGFPGGGGHLADCTGRKWCAGA